jgi:hypothetical protein
MKRSWKHILNIVLVAFLAQYGSNDFGNYNVRESRAPVDSTLGTYEVRGVSGVSAIHAAVLPNSNIFLFGRIRSWNEKPDEGIVRCSSLIVRQNLLDLKDFESRENMI